MLTASPLFFLNYLWSAEWIFTFVFCHLYNIHPPYCLGFLPPMNLPTLRTLVTKGSFSVPRTNTKSSGQNSFRFQAPNVWKSIPTYIHNFDTPSSLSLKQARGCAYCRILCKYCILGVQYAFWPHRCIIIRKMLNTDWTSYGSLWLPRHSTLAPLAKSATQLTISVLSHSQPWPCTPLCFTLVQVQSMKGGIWMMTK